MINFYFVKYCNVTFVLLTKEICYWVDGETYISNKIDCDHKMAIFIENYIIWYSVKIV